MVFLPVERMWERVDIAREDSDASLFIVLMYFGELVTKTTVAGFVAAVADRGHQYRQLYRLVRADGLGEWDQTLDDVLTGPASQSLLSEASSKDKRELTQKMSPGTWQYDAIKYMSDCLKVFDISYDLPNKIDVRKFFTIILILLNKTKAH